jgi:cellulose synthase/poly-beta-1,6-N-acetylglucosamine synthase-like glycosyltransferase
MTTWINALRNATGNGARNYAGIANRKSWLFVTMFVLWGLLVAWFHPRLSSILDDASSPFEWVSMAYFVVFVEIAWLYGVYNICIVLFSLIDRYMPKQAFVYPEAMPDTPVAMLYTTCNDFVEKSALSCLTLDYENYKLYILDDSSKPEFKQRVDRFAAEHGERVQVIRRENRQGYKAGNLNHALSRYIAEPLFAIVDADEILPRNFLRRLVPQLMADPNCGFVQANHICAKEDDNKLKSDMHLGVDIHWKWYQPLRNRFGFVMFLGHGALLRSSCWKQVGGFPELVSEDLAYAISIRELGYYGTFAEDVVCMEDFPDSVRSFRVRHIKWTRGTCEFLANCMGGLVKSPNISWVEKLDILFPTVNLPMTFFFFIFMINSGILMPFLMGQKQDLTLVIGGSEYIMPMIAMPEFFVKLYDWDFFAITVFTIMAPVLCFILALSNRPMRLFKFLSHSTALYATLSPITSIAVFGYLLTGKARFLVTGDSSDAVEKGNGGQRESWWARASRFMAETHPNHKGLRIAEFVAGVAFLAVALFTFQIAFIGLAIGFMLMPFMHHYGWDHALTRTLVWLPFSMILLGIFLGGMGMFGMYPVMFGYGFHF